MNEKTHDMMGSESAEQFASLDKECKASSFYEGFIDGLDCSARIKRVLRELARRTAWIGGRMVRIGKIALDFTLKVMGEVRRRFPNLACAIIVLLILKALIHCIPVIGLILGPLLEPVFMVVLVGIGVTKDVLEMVRPASERHYGAQAAVA